VLAARSLQEARLYVDLQPCDCGTTSPFDPEFAVEEHDGQSAVVYAGTCPGCGRERRFEFAGVPAGDGFGVAEASSIIDPGEFLWVSDAATDQALSSATSPDSQGAARAAFETALAALDEVLKFVEPGATEVSADQIRSELGRTVYDANPDRFQVERLQQRRAMIADAQDRAVRANA
jgi:hypothetical protein